MNQYSRFNLPLCLTVEENAFLNIKEILDEYIPEIKNQKALIISEKFLVDLYSEKIEAIKNGFCKAELYQINEASFDESVKIAKKICLEDFKVVVGFGGGRVLDTAKYASHISKAVYICLPTTLSNDSLASPVAVLQTEGLKRKTLSCKIPAAIIVDTTMIINAPLGQTLSGIGDTLAKHTALFDWKLSAKKTGNHIDDFAYAISRMSFDSVFYCDEKNLKSRAFIRILSRALVMGGLAMEISGDSRPCSGSEHLFSHAIEEFYPEIKITHGIGVALGSIGSCIFQNQDEKKLMSVMKTYGISYKPSDYGITKDIFINCWQKASSTRSDRITILNYTDLNSTYLAEIYERMENE